MGHFLPGKEKKTRVLARKWRWWRTPRGAVTASCQATRVTFLKRHRLSTARQSRQPKRRTDCARFQLAFFSSFLSSLVLPSLVLAQEPVEGAKSVVYSISEVYVAKDRIKIKVRDPIVNSN